MLNNFAISIEQDNTVINFSVNSDKKVTLSRIAGTMANEVFAYFDIVRKTGLKSSIKFHKPFRLRFSAEKELLVDTGAMLSVDMQTKLRLVNNPKSKKAFCGNLYTFLVYMSRQPEMVEFADLITDLNKQIEEREALKIAESIEAGK